MKAAIYTRISDRSQNDDLQLREVPTYVQQRGWTLTDTYSDTISGARDRRPALDRLMADARRRRFDVVVVYRFDRFARSTSHLLRALEEFNSLGIAFVSLHEAVDTSTPMGKAMFTIIGGDCRTGAQHDRGTLHSRSESSQEARCQVRSSYSQRQCVQDSRSAAGRAFLEGDRGEG
jgi:Resolvase, N terminal domain